MGFAPWLEELDSSNFNLYSVQIFHSTFHSIISVWYLFLYMLNSHSFSIITISTPVVFQGSHIIQSHPKYGRFQCFKGPLGVPRIGESIHVSSYVHERCLDHCLRGYDPTIDSRPYLRHATILPMSQYSMGNHVRVHLPY